MKELLTIQDAADTLRVSTRTIFNYIREKKLNPVKIGGTKKAGKTYIPQKEIKKLLNTEV